MNNSNFSKLRLHNTINLNFGKSPERKQPLHDHIEHTVQTWCVEGLDQQLHPARLEFAPQHYGVFRFCKHNCCLQLPIQGQEDSYEENDSDYLIKRKTELLTPNYLISNTTAQRRK